MQRRLDAADVEKPSDRVSKDQCGRRRIAVALQGGGSHGAFICGVLDRLLQEPSFGISGSSAAP